ncbi:MAG: RNA polymerase sigma-70 factor [Gemmatimonadaceae bacterium]|nr:RNA polymerase sigma-70 factor [Gemmatimonadaceae bacterium]
MSSERAALGRSEKSAHVDPPPDPSPETQALWLARIARGDTDAFEALFRAFYDRLRDFAEMFLRSRHTAEEIVDDVFLALWAGRDTLRVKGSVASYLYVAVRNRALGFLHRRKLEQRYVDQVERERGGAADDGRNDVEETVRMNELFARAQAAIDALPDRSRETYLLYYQHGLSYVEIAQGMGVSVRTVENQLARSVKRLWRGSKRSARRSMSPPTPATPSCKSSPRTASWRCDRRPCARERARSSSAGSAGRSTRRGSRASSRG